MKLLFLALFASVSCAYGQMDANLLALGDWSEAVQDSGGFTLRGRLLVYDEQMAPNHARIYFELQHVFKGPGWWEGPIELYFDGGSENLHFEMLDRQGHSVPMHPTAVIGPSPSPYWISIPCDSTVRVRADWYNMGPPSKRDGLELLVVGGCWILRPDATNEFFLTASFTPSKDHASPLRYHVWDGTLKLPKVKIPVPKLDRASKSGEQQNSAVAPPPPTADSGEVTAQLEQIRKDFGVILEMRGRKVTVGTSGLVTEDEIKKIEDALHKTMGNDLQVVHVVD